MANKYEWSLFILRIVLGISFFIHGLDKFQSGLGNIAGWFSSIGLPGMLAYGVAFLELVGGIALVIGLGTRIVSALVALLMIGATLKVKLETGFLGGYELDLAFLAMSVALLISGSRLYALDQAFFSKKEV